MVLMCRKLGPCQ